MQLEVGKYYKTRDGRKVGPMVAYGSVFEGYEALHVGPIDGRIWRVSDGLHYPENNKSFSEENDIIAEWTNAVSAPTLSPETIDHIAIDSLKFHIADNDMEPLQKEAFRIVLRYYGVTL